MKGSKKVSLNNIMANAKPVALSVAGGWLGVKATNFIQQQSFMVGKETYAPVVTAMISIVGAVVVPDMKDLFMGAATVALTEMAEKAEAAAVSAVTPAAATTSTTVTQGINKMLGRGAMGFVPQVLVDGQSGLRFMGKPVR